MAKNHVANSRGNPFQQDVVGIEKYLLLDYKVQVKFAGIWITVKSFHDEDEEYAKNCANELLEKLNEKI